MCACTSVFAASAARRLSSPARTAAATTRASFLALSPGISPPPLHPTALRHALCAGSPVPPPTVPTSRLGIVHEIQRSPSRVSSIRVMQLDDSTFWAGSCPVARKTAVTTLAAWALNPPKAPAMAEPTRFFWRFVFTMEGTSVLRVDRTTSFGMVASTITDLPRPSIQLVAAAFLSVHMFPLRATSTSEGNFDLRSSITARLPFDTMFIPMASPEKHRSRRYTLRPATVGSALRSLPKLVVDSNASLRSAKFSGTSHHSFSSAASIALRIWTQGARVMPSRTTALRAPPPWDTALHPRFALATKHPSVVAMGMYTVSPSNVRGPIIPQGMGTYPTTISQLAPCTRP
mmetsp:Transcript_9699/g.20527  ORF Transcript_9699/g.20527 Transcript_9699/m.20527 type:complete len:346 (+) Transcript_9699:339-1376(+)